MVRAPVVRAEGVARPIHRPRTGIRAVVGASIRIPSPRSAASRRRPPPVVRAERVTRPIHRPRTRIRAVIGAGIRIPLDRAPVVRAEGVADAIHRPRTGIRAVVGAGVRIPLGTQIRTGVRAVVRAPVVRAERVARPIHRPRTGIRAVVGAGVGVVRVPIVAGEHALDPVQCPAAPARVRVDVAVLGCAAVGVSGGRRRAAPGRRPAGQVGGAQLVALVHCWTSLRSSASSRSSANSER